MYCCRRIQGRNKTSQSPIGHIGESIARLLPHTSHPLYLTFPSQPSAYITASHFGSSFAQPTCWCRDNERTLAFPLFPLCGLHSSCYGLCSNSNYVNWSFLYCGVGFLHGSSVVVGKRHFCISQSIEMRLRCLALRPCSGIVANMVRPALLI